MEPDLRFSAWKGEAGGHLAWTLPDGRIAVGSFDHSWSWDAREPILIERPGGCAIIAFGLAFRLWYVDAIVNPIPLDPVVGWIAEGEEMVWADYSSIVYEGEDRCWKRQGISIDGIDGLKIEEDEIAANTYIGFEEPAERIRLRKQDGANLTDKGWVPKEWPRAGRDVAPAISPPSLLARSVGWIWLLIPLRLGALAIQYRHEPPVWVPLAILSMAGTSYGVWRSHQSAKRPQSPAEPKVEPSCGLIAFVAIGGFCVLCGGILYGAMLPELRAQDLAGAACEGNTEKVRAMLKAGMDPNAIPDEFGFSALSCAVGNEHPEVAKLLVDHGALAFEKGPHFDTPWSMAGNDAMRRILKQAPDWKEHAGSSQKGQISPQQVRRMQGLRTL